ncbi:MAG: hypothetical protein LUD73_06195, partial [Lachnospiraceae bacterium]|nr:hypothetical protein [Lachnospiraceae bacterium]
MKAVLFDASSAIDADYSIQQKMFEENGIDFVVGDVTSMEEARELCRGAEAALTSSQDVTGDLRD